MTSINTPAKHVGTFLVLITATVTIGCTSPPSVAPLLRVTERALLEESDRLSRNVERDKSYTRQSLGVLEDAYHRDLMQTDVLTPQWVREATAVYVAARESVLEHEASLIREHEARAENLRDAAAATRRAIALIEQQDSLLRGVMGDDLRRLLDGFDDLRKDPNP